MYETVVGLQVQDDEAYTAYRQGMTPILESYGGGFRYDFRVGEVLKSETDAAINRLFIIGFPDRETMERFFADPEYIRVRQQHFEPSVAAVTILAEYEA